MTERSIFSGSAPQLVIRAGGDVTVKGQESDRVLAETSSAWGLQVRRKKDTLEVQIGGSGQVSSVSVNGQSAGPFQSCVSGAMRKITFPKFDGSLTRASFSMSFK